MKHVTVCWAPASPVLDPVVTRRGRGRLCVPRGGRAIGRVGLPLLGLLAAVLTETSHASHLLSIASTLLRQLHPVRTLPVARRPALSLSVTISLLGLAYNTIVLPPPPSWACCCVRRWRN